MTKDYEIYLNKELMYYKGKCEVYEKLLITAGLIEAPKIYIPDNLKKEK